LAAFEELVYRYEGRIFRFLANSCGSEADAREITQDTFLRAYQAIDKFDSNLAFRPWLFTIARRKCIDHYRSAPPPSVELPPDTPDANDPSELLARREDRQNLWRLARQCLPEAQFQALWLRYAEDMSVAETARVLHKTQTHVKVLLFRARQTLARELEPRGNTSATTVLPAAAASALKSSTLPST
jgi:RNA polymerase sigma-70 factor (ECF subfamily)